MNYLYDGSFDGLLTTIYHDYYSGRAAGIYQQDSAFQSTLFGGESKIVDTDTSLSDRVWQAIESKLSESALSVVYRVFLSNASDKELLILHFLRYSFSVGSLASSYYTHPHIQPALKIASQVGFESHRYLGLLRFSDTKNFLYAPFAPDHNVLPLIAEHFTDRLKYENFIIHDTRRQLAVIHDSGDSWRLQVLDETLINQLGREGYSKDLVRGNSEEILYQSLWSCYFNTISIESRKNTRLQSQFIPRKYRSHLVEMNPASHTN